MNNHLTLGFFNQIQVGIDSYSSGFLRRPQNFVKISQVINNDKYTGKLHQLCLALLGNINFIFHHALHFATVLLSTTISGDLQQPHSIEDRIGGSRSVPHFHLILHEKYQMQCALRLHKLLFLFCFSYVLLWWWCWNYQRLQEFNRWIVKGVSWLKIFQCFKSFRVKPRFVLTRQSLCCSTQTWLLLFWLTGRPGARNLWPHYVKWKF